MENSDGSQGHAVPVWPGLDEEALWKVEREYCAPVRRGKRPSADATHNPLSRCGEILLDPIYEGEVRFRNGGLNDALFGRAVGFENSATFSRFRRGRYAGDFEGQVGWRKARRLLRAMLLGTGFTIEAELDTADPKQAIVHRMENYFFGADDSGPFFDEHVMNSSVPAREEEAAYEVLWLAHQVWTTRTRGEFYVVSGGEELAPRHQGSLGPKVALAAAAVGVKCFVLYPHPGDFGHTKSRESFRKFAATMPAIWADPHCRGYVRSISPVLASRPAPLDNFLEIPVRAHWRSADGRLWGAQFMQPAFRYSYLHAPVMPEPRFLILRSPGSIPFCWVGVREEANGFKQWADMVLARHKEEEARKPARATGGARLSK